MTTTKMILSLTLVAGGALGAATSVAHAGAFDDLRPKLTRTDRGVEFTVQCDPHSASSSESGTANKDLGFSSSHRFTPQCTLFGTEKGATYMCQCAGDGSSILGELQANEIFPGGELPAEGGDGLAVSALIIASCDEVLENHCGPFPEPIREPCQSEQGSCMAAALPGENLGEYDGLVTSCNCTSGPHWETYDALKEPVTLSQEQMQDLCQAELQNCAPGATPGPSEPELFEEELVMRRFSACAHFREGVSPGEFNPARCEVISDGEIGSYECSSIDQAFAAQYEVDGLESREQLYARCIEMRKGLAIPKPDPEDKESDGAGAGEFPDILDKLGCSVASEGDPSSWYLALIGLIAGVRRRRSKR